MASLYSRFAGPADDIAQGGKAIMIAVEWATFGLLGLFVSAFTSATLLPGTSEIVLTGLLAEHVASAGMLVLVATCGNVAGSITNFLLGRYALRFSDRTWFPISQSALDRASERYRQYGFWSLLLAWLPVIGDPLTLAAGVMGEPFWRFVVLVTLSKAARYAAVAFGVSALL